MYINSSKQVKKVCKILACVENDNMNIQWKCQVYTVIHFEITTRYQKSINGNSWGTLV